tara:strand:+ start:349 stop:1029 length:681 start_codon:yes stop_codon:yes gene_type:complete
MATNTVSGFLNCSDGTSIPLQAELAEGTESNLSVNATYAVASGVEIGDYAPGKTIVSGNVMSQNGISYCYVLRQGLIAAVIPINIEGVMSDGNTPLWTALTLQAGDVVRCMNNTAADRECAVSCITASGTNRIFIATPSTGATNLLLDLQTGNNLGSTLQGETIVKAFGTSVDGSLVDGGGAVAVNEVGQVVGVVPLTDPSESQPMSSTVRIPVALNYAWQVVTTA